MMAAQPARLCTPKNVAVRDDCSTASSCTRLSGISSHASCGRILVSHSVVCVQVDGVARVQVSKTIYHLTDMQDIRGVIGYKAHCSQKGRVTLVRSSTLVALRDSLNNTPWNVKRIILLSFKHFTKH